MKSAESDDNGMMTPSIFIESVLQQKNDQEFKEAYLAVCRQFFHILDVNCDGFLQESEYARSFTSVGLQDIGIVRRAFESIDLNQDGKLSLEEFSNAMLQYLISEDENSRFTELWGPLVAWFLLIYISPFRFATWFCIDPYLRRGGGCLFNAYVLL